jgi:prepilin peptidase CpaA
LARAPGRLRNLLFTPSGDDRRMLALPFLLVFPALAIVAAMKDATSYTIPNWISLALIASYAPAAAVAGLPLGVIGFSVLFALAALVAGMAMFALGWIGGGDAKFLASASLWIGLSGAAHFLVVTALCGGLLATGLLALRSVWLRPLTVRAPGWVGRLATPDADAPYGVAIAAGALYAFPLSAFATALPVLFHG